MKTIILAAVAAVIFGGATMAPPASAACLSNGATIVCRPGPGPYELLDRYFMNPYDRPALRSYR